MGRAFAPLETKWYVVTGGPSCGKSTVMNRLAYLGHAVRPETARLYIDDELSKGRTLEQIRSDELAFQSKVLEMKKWAEERAPLSERIFWDRGMPDSIVYLERCGADATPAREASAARRYHRVFLLERIPYQSDYCRTEDEKTAQAIHEALGRCYRSLGYEVVEVPLASIAERAEFILARL